MSWFDAQPGLFPEMSMMPGHPGMMVLIDLTEMKYLPGMTGEFQIGNETGVMVVMREVLRLVTLIVAPGMTVIMTGVAHHATMVLDLEMVVIDGHEQRTMMPVVIDHMVVEMSRE